MSLKVEDVSFPSENHKRQYITMMDMYAKSGKGMIFTLPSGNKFGDLALETEYRWQHSKSTAWLKNRALPTSPEPSSLCSNTKLVTAVLIMPRIRRACDGDIIITPTIFKRLDETAMATVILIPFNAEWFALVPRGAIVFNKQQRKKYAEGKVGANGEGGYAFGECLKPGFRPEKVMMGYGGCVGLPGEVGLKVATVGEVMESAAV